MPIPVLAGAVGFVGKLFGNIFGPAGKARRAARRAKRKAKGKKGIFGGFFKNIFGKKRSKGQKLIDRSQSLLEKRLKTDAKLKAQMEEAARKSGANTLQDYLDSHGNVKGALPFDLQTSQGFRNAQQFSLPPDVQNAFEATKAKFAILPTADPRNKGLVLDTQTIVIGVLGLGVVIYFATR